ncbi:spore cortex biosynthesis protein YabQ [Sporosarcina sp. 179-K 3D1 HS]|uniref:spore cortex biosynthesis protein YabQ n=1 Tax=Sporosarcina sp. 179-K 3D1 HS TaxID=3232169 RepID=UPI0039A1BC3E
MSLSVQFLSLLAMIGTGVVGGALIDLIQTGTANAGKRSIIRRKAIWFETIGWIAVGCGSFYVLYLVRDGAWRMYDPVAQICGLLLYASVFHKPFRLVGRIVLLVVIKPIWFVLRLAVSIIRQIIRFVLRLSILLFTPFIRVYQALHRKLFKPKGN